MRRVSDHPKDMHRYDDMLEMSRHISGTHRSMAQSQRAAQFMPFAALTGYEEAIQKSGTIKPQQKVLSDNQIQALNNQLQFLSEHPHCEIRITYFLDHTGYQVLQTNMYQIDAYTQKCVIDKKMNISFRDILRIDIVEGE